MADARITFLGRKQSNSNPTSYSTAVTLQVYNLSNNLGDYAALAVTPNISSYDANQRYVYHLRTNTGDSGWTPSSTAKSYTFDMWIPSHTSNKSVPPADGNDYLDVKIWMQYNNSWYAVGSTLRINLSYAWLYNASYYSIARKNILSGKYQVGVEFSGSTRYWTSSSGVKYAWYTQFGLSEDKYLEVPAGFIDIEKSVSFEPATSNVNRIYGLDTLTTYYVYLSGTSEYDSTWFLAHDDQILSSEHDSTYALNNNVIKVTTPGILIYHYNNGPITDDDYQFFNIDASLTLKALSSMSGGGPSYPNTSATITTTFNANGGTVSPTSRTSQEITSYVFDKWTTGQAGSGSVYRPSTSYYFTRDTDLYAQYAVDSVNYTAITLPTPTMSGAGFKGWYTDPVGGTRVGVGGDRYYPEYNQTLYAQWGIAITFDANGGNSVPDPQGFTPGEPSILTTEVATKSSVSTSIATTFDSVGGVPPTQTHTSYKTQGYSFREWSDNPDGTGSIYLPGGTYTFNQAQTLYAQYDETISYTSLILPLAAMQGQALLGWYTSAVGGDSIGIAGDEFTPHENNTYYAHWGVKIIFNANGGTDAPSPIDAAVGSTITIPSEIPSKTVRLTYDTNTSNDTGTDITATVTPAYQDCILQFVGWSTTQTQHGDTAEYYPGDPLHVSSNLTLYAVWKESTVSNLPVYTTDTSVVPGIYRSTNRSMYRLDTDTPWTTQPGGNIEIESIYSDTTIYAKWEYLIKLDANEGIFTDDPVYPEEEDEDVHYTTTHEYWKKFNVDLSLDYRPTSTGLKISREGYDALGFSTSSSATSVGPNDYPLQFTYVKNQPTYRFVIWKVETFTVTFLDGFSPSGQDVIKTLTKSYGSIVTSDDLPVYNTYYGPPYNKTFVRDSMYSLMGWIGYYDNMEIYYDTVIVAMWDRVPVWIMIQDELGKRWVKYEPEEPNRPGS